LTTDSNSSGISNTVVQGGAKMVTAEQWQQTCKMATTMVANKKPKQKSTGSNTTATTAASSNRSFACNTIVHWDGDSKSSGCTNGRDSDCNSKIKNEF